MTKVTIKDIARMAGVSIGTVDRVLHNRGEVSKATREQIEKIITENNYTPDILASNLALKRNFFFAVLMPDTVNEHVFWDLPIKGIDEALEEAGHFNISIDYIRFSQTNRNDFLNKVKNFPFDRFNGILFAPVFHKESADFIQSARAQNVPVVLFNSLIEGADYMSYVGQDAFKSGYLAGKLMSYGLQSIRNIIVMNLSARKDNYSHIIGREEGFRHYFEEHSGRLMNLITVDLSGADDRVLTREFENLIKKFDPAGIFVTNSRVHMVARYLSDNGILSIRLIGYDLLPASKEYLRREYIDFLISQKPEEQARKGLLSLINLTVLNKQPEREQLIPLDIITKENIEYYK
jgi:LacI family transcriptional regulator